MKYAGTIEIKEGFELTNPVMEVKGIFDNLDEDGNLLNKYLEIHFTSEDSKVKIHARGWKIEEGVTSQEFIDNHNVLNKFK